MAGTSATQKVSLMLQKSQRILTRKKTPGNSGAYAPEAARQMLAASVSAHALPDCVSEYVMPLESRRDPPKHSFMDTARTADSARSRRSQRSVGGLNSTHGAPSRLYLQPTSSFNQKIATHSNQGGPSSASSVHSSYLQKIQNNSFARKSASTHGTAPRTAVAAARR